MCSFLLGMTTISQFLYSGEFLRNQEIFGVNRLNSNLKVIKSNSYLIMKSNTYNAKFGCRIGIMVE